MTFHSRRRARADGARAMAALSLCAALLAPVLQAQDFREPATGSNPPPVPRLPGGAATPGAAPAGEDGGMQAAPVAETPEAAAPAAQPVRARQPDQAVPARPAPQAAPAPPAAAPPPGASGGAAVVVVPAGARTIPATGPLPLPARRK